MLTLFFAHFPFGVLMALLTPDNILDYTWAHTYTNFVAELLPLVSAIGRYTKVPATQFMAALFSLVTSFYWILFAYVYLKYNVQGSVRYFQDRSLREKAGLVICPFFFGSAVWIIFFDGLKNGFVDSRFTFMIGSKLAMGTYGIGLISGLWGGACFVFCFIFIFFHIIKYGLAQRKIP